MYTRAVPLESELPYVELNQAGTSRSPSLDITPASRASTTLVGSGDVTTNGYSRCSTPWDAKTRRSSGPEPNLDLCQVPARRASTRLTGAWDVTPRSPSEEEAEPLVQNDRSVRRDGKQPRLGVRIRWPICDPEHSRFLVAWDATITLLVIFVTLSWPVEAVFVFPARATDTCDIAVSSAFLVDMFLQFFIKAPHPQKPFMLTSDPALIARVYLTGWFPGDLLAIMGTVMVQIANFTGRNSMVPSPFSPLLRSTKLLRIARAWRLARRWRSSIGLGTATMQLAKNVLMVVTCCHWTACAWSALAFRDVPGHTWLSALEASKGGDADLYENQLDIYIMSLYWATFTVTSTGYGDINPQNRAEYLVAAITMALTAAMWAYVIGDICGILSTLNAHEIEFKRALDDLNTLIAERNVPASMTSRLRRYFHETKNLSKYDIERAVIERLSPTLQGEVCLLLYDEWLRRVCYLKSLDVSMISWVAKNLTITVYAPRETIFQERALYILRRGLCTRKSKMLLGGEVWGADMVISSDHLRDTANTVSLSYSEVCMLAHCDVIPVLEAMPETRSRLHWSRIRIAVHRGVVFLSRVVMRLRNNPSTKDFWSLVAGSDGVRFALYADILQGVDWQRRLPDYVALSNKGPTGSARGGHVKPAGICASTSTPPKTNGQMQLLLAADERHVTEEPLCQGSKEREAELVDQAILQLNTLCEDHERTLHMLRDMRQKLMCR